MLHSLYYTYKKGIKSLNTEYSQEITFHYKFTSIQTLPNTQSARPEGGRMKGAKVKRESVGEPL